MVKAKLTPKQKKTIIAVVAVFLTVVLGLVAWLVLVGGVLDKNTQTPFPQQLGEVQDKAGSYLEANDIDAGLNYYDEQILSRDSNDEKQTLLVMKSSFATAGGRFDEAVSIAKQADDLGSNSSTLQAIGDAYRASGDSEQALSYYKMSLEASSKEENDSQSPDVSRGPSVEDFIRELE